MDLVIWLVVITVSIIQIIMIVKFFEIASDISAIRAKQEKIVEFDFKKQFYKYIIADNAKKARETLFDAISTTSEFDKIMKGVNETYRDKLQSELNSKFNKELTILGIKEIDLSKIENNQ